MGVREQLRVISWVERRLNLGSAGVGMPLLPDLSRCPLGAPLSRYQASTDRVVLMRERQYAPWPVLGKTIGTLKEHGMSRSSPRDGQGLPGRDVR